MTFLTVFVLVVRVRVFPSLLAPLDTDTVLDSPPDLDRDLDRECVLSEEYDEDDEDRCELLLRCRVSKLSTKRMRIVLWSADFSLNQSLG